MTIHSLLRQVALHTSSEFQRNGAVSCITLALDQDRHQKIFGKMEQYEGEELAVLHTEIGTFRKGMDLISLFRLSGDMRYSKIVTLDGDRITIMALLELEAMSLARFARVLQEMAAFADEIERLLSEEDSN
ncbi:MAG: hypothetical protein CL946_09065 [Ectothiorhodospiraceae bacterium]|nr:hypothetical protein [Ectothiorhodospiraceae bacterium]